MHVHILLVLLINGHHAQFQEAINKSLTFDFTHSYSYCVSVASNLNLNIDVDAADTTFWGRLFQWLITLELKKCCLVVVLTLSLNNFTV